MWKCDLLHYNNYSVYESITWSLYTIFVSYTLVRLGKKKRVWGCFSPLNGAQSRLHVSLMTHFAYTCQSPAPAARESSWRDERCWRRMMQPLTQGTGLHVYFRLQVHSYTLTKSLGQMFGIFSFPLTQIYCLYKTLLPFKQSFCFSDSLRILVTLTCDYTVTHAYVWAV